MMDQDTDCRIEHKIRFYESQLQNFYEIGKALSSEKDTFKLLDLIITNSINLTSSDAGTIYLVVDKETGNLSFLNENQHDGKLLKFVILKNQSMDIQVAESFSLITSRSICGYAAITGLPVKIDDAYAISEHEKYSHDKNFDLKTGYLTRSVLTVPMKTHEHKVVGVIQLINKKKPGTGHLEFDCPDSLSNIIPYNEADILVILSLAGQAAVVMENNLLYRDMEILLQNYKEQNAQLEILSRNILKAHEEERKRIARDIHDGPAQSVANLSFGVEICKKYLENGNSEKLYEALNRLNQNVKATAKEVRNIIYNLKPSYLDQGLVMALENHFKNFTSNTGIEVRFTVPKEEVQLEYYLTSTIYRIVQEAFSNIHKHAAASRVEVHLWLTRDDLVLTITDDGQGFDPAMQAGSEYKSATSGFGLEGMRERAELIHGKVSIDSKPGAGTKITLTISR